MNMLVTCSTRPSRRESLAFAQRRSPVLVVGDPADHPLRMEISARLARSNAASLVASAPADLSEDGGQTGFEELDEAWSRLEEEFHSASIGLVATSPRTVASISRMLAKGWVDGSIPGAIVLLGYSRSFGAVCLHVAGQLAAQSRARAGDGKDKPPVVTDWPAMLFLLPRDEPMIVECLDACGKLRSVEIAVEFAVYEATRQEAVSSADEAVRLMHEFFSRHLVQHFPKRI